MDTIQAPLSLLCLTLPLLEAHFLHPLQQPKGTFKGFCAGNFLFQANIHSRLAICPLYLASLTFVLSPPWPIIQNCKLYSPRIRVLLYPFPVLFLLLFCLAFTVYLFILYMVSFLSWNVSFMRQFCSVLYHQCLILAWHVTYF